MQHFNDVEISYSSDGYGIQGVCSQQLSFSLPMSEYGESGDLFPYGSKVLLSCGMAVPVFYVSSRSPSGNKLSMTCYDIAMFSDNTPDIADGDYDKDNKISLATVISKINHACGFDGISLGSAIPKITMLSKDNVSGKSSREILSGLAEGAYGCFVGSGSGLAFMPFACAPFSAMFAVDKHSGISKGLSKTCDYIRITDGTNDYESGSPSSGAYHSAQIETPYASAEFAGAVIGELRGKTYTAWECSNALVSEYPSPGAGISFELGETLVTNYCRMKVTSTGCYASMGRNTVTENEYVSRMQREINDRVALGKTYGNTKTTQDGVKYVYRDKNSDGEVTAVEEYGCIVQKGGIIEHESVNLDAAPKSVARVSDNEVIYIYDGYSIRVTAEGEGDTRTNPQYEIIYE